MKRNLLLLSAVMTISFNISIAIAASNTEVKSAESILISYFDALKMGNVNTLKSLTRGELYSKRLRLFNNPTYPQHLIKHYSNATFQVLQIEWQNANTIIITASISTEAEAESKTRKFVLVKSGNLSSDYYIHDEYAVLN